MHVGLNLIFLVPGQTGGMETAARELVPELLRARPEWRFTAFVNREAQAAGLEWLERCEQVVVPVRATSRVQWTRGEQLLLPRLAERTGVDLVHSLANTAPARGRFRRVLTIHDLIHRIHPEAHSRVRAAGLRWLVALGARRSHRVIADSNSTRDDIVRLLGVDAHRIDVVPLGVGMSAAAEPTPEAELRGRLDLGDRPVVFALSAHRPHKNLMRLLDALATLPTEGRPVLVAPGYPTGYEAELISHAAELGIAADVRLPDWVSNPDVEGLYRLARVFVFPSLYEGFGLPVLEAMCRGVPVACSSASSLPEVAGDAALLFDPGDTTQIAAAIQRLLADPELAATLVARGREQCARFSWRAAAASTVAVYERAMGLRESV
jgi:glycosyltransferase involved in cell wall biosynthesis